MSKLSIKKFLKKYPKLKNPYFYISLIGLIFASVGVDFNSLTSWKLLGEAILNILDNPVSVLGVITAVVGIWNNNDTPGLSSDNTTKKQNKK